MKVNLLKQEKIINGGVVQVLAPGEQEIRDDLAKRLIIKGTAIPVPKKKEGQ